MKGFLTALLLSSFCSCLAQDSPLSAVKRMELMSDELVSYAQALMKKNIEPTEKMLENKVYSILEGSFSGPALLAAKQNVREGLSRGWPLANTDDFGWAFPMPSPLFGSARILSGDDSSALVEYRGGVMDSYFVFEEKDQSLSESSFFQIEDNNLFLDSRDLHTKVDYRATIRLVKTSVGWRIVDFKNSFAKQIVSSEG